jgi:hypothetical protein
MAVRKKSAVAEIFQVKVTLLWTDPPVWRRLLLPADLTLEQLHIALQISMGWHDSHLHEFFAGGRRFGPPEPGEDCLDEGKSRLPELLASAGAKAIYTYDFGDSWEHEILLEERLPAAPGQPYPACTAGEGACPPEDCGGVPGYYELLEAIGDPKHERRAEVRAWLGTGRDPRVFPIEKVNLLLHGARPRRR